MLCAGQRSVVAFYFPKIEGRKSVNKLELPYTELQSGYHKKSSILHMHVKVSV